MIAGERKAGVRGLREQSRAPGGSLKPSNEGISASNLLRVMLKNEP